MAVRIGGVDMDGDKWACVSLASIFGIGSSLASKILKETNVENKKFRCLTDDEIQRIRTYIAEHCVIEGELRSDIKTNIKRLKDIGSYRGIRHEKGLPVRGQRTRTNCRTRKGKKKTVANKKKAEK